jgi:CubicO group peptidase (beta-lactamase class C family)
MATILRALLVVFVATSSFAQDASRLDQIVKPYVQDKTFMGSVLVARGEEILLSKGYGSANLEWEVPNTPSTKFRLGSITKQFTAASILLLEERGKLKLDDPIKKFLRDAPAAWDRITLFNLLTHSSGIPNFTALPEYKSLEVLDTPVVKTIATVRDKPLDFFPGEKMSYSNSGYLVLGYVIENVSGVSYESFVQENIFTPLGMKDSGYDSNTTVIAHRAAGYSPSPKGPVNAGYIHMSIPHAAGALYSTTEDLLRWEQGLFGGKVVSPASLQKMITPFKNNYALGVTVQTTNGRKVVQHGGGIEGFNTFLSYYPDDKLTVAVLANVNGSVPGTLAAKLGAAVHGDTVQAPGDRKEIALPAETLAKYVGTYEFTPEVKLAVRLSGGQLMAQLTGQGQIPIFPESETKFFLKIVDAQLDFMKDAGGAVTSVDLHQNGVDQTATRTSATPPPPPGETHKETTVPASTLSKYTGTYQMRPNVDLTVTLEGDHLMAQLTGQPKFQIFPESETVFFYKIVEATLEFQSESGTTTGVRLKQGPINTVLPKQ